MTNPCNHNLAHYFSMPSLLVSLHRTNADKVISLYGLAWNPRVRCPLQPFARERSSSALNMTIHIQLGSEVKGSRSKSNIDLQLSHRQISSTRNYTLRSILNSMIMIYQCYLFILTVHTYISYCVLSWTLHTHQSSNLVVHYCCRNPKWQDTGQRCNFFSY